MGIITQSAKKCQPPILIQTEPHEKDNSQSLPSGTPTLKTDYKGSYSNPSILTNNIDMKECNAPVSNRTWAQELEISSIPSIVVPDVVSC